MTPRGAIWAAALAGCGVGVFAAGGPHGAIDAELLRVLRFFALVKLGLALGVLALLDWRARRGLGGRAALGYAGAAAAMAAAAPLIWGANVIAGAVLFHGGWIAAAVTGWGESRARRPAAARPERVVVPA